MYFLKNFLIIFIILISNLVSANTYYRQINYKITPLSNTSVSAIKVETEIIGNMSGEVVLDLPYAWANATYYKQIKNVKLEYPIGKLQFRNQDSHEKLF